MSLKNAISKLVIETGLAPQVLMRKYMMDRFLLRLSKTEYSDNFVLKGGVLISELVNIENRATMDLDGLLNGIQFSREKIIELFEVIAKMDANDGVKFEFCAISEIREGNPYGGFRLKAKANMQTIVENLSFDFSSGDPIVPAPVKRKHCTLLSNDLIDILTYPVETVLAEKLQTIFDHGLNATRMRDYYDVYLLSTMHTDAIDFTNLKTAMAKTSAYRNTSDVFDDWEDDLFQFQNDDKLNVRWKQYVDKYTYVDDISFVAVTEAVRKVMANVAV
jgi:predicted nucleotidyltransferase component of viral defense system